VLEKNILIEKMSLGIPIIGTWNTLGSPLVTEVFAQSGFDFQIIDLEHGPFILDQVHLHVSACENSINCTPLVRVPTNDEWMLLQVLDQGAHGIVVPHIDSIKSAKNFVNKTKYYPAGQRGFTPFSKAGGFNNINISSYIECANKEVVNIIIIESKDGLNNLEQIVSIDAIDIVYFGAYDLSQDLGYPGEVNHPEVVKAIQKGVDIVNKSEKYAGGFVPQSKDDVKLLLDMGMKFITYEVDSSIIYKQTQNIVEWFSNEI